MNMIGIQIKRIYNFFCRKDYISADTCLTDQSKTEGGPLDEKIFFSKQFSDVNQNRLNQPTFLC